MADEPQGTDGRNQPENVHDQPTQAWQGPRQRAQAPPPAPPSASQPPQPPQQNVHYQPTQAWQGAQQPPAPQQPSAPQQPPTPQYPPPGIQPPPSSYPQHPGPYGYPQQGVQQSWGGPVPQPGAQPYPGPGYPPQSGYLMAPVPAPARGGNGGVIAAVVAGLLTVALIVGGIVLFTGGDHEDGKPSSDAGQLAAQKFTFGPDRTVLWTAKADSASTSGSASLVGQWFAHRTLVVGDQKALISYDVKTGRQGWTMQSPEAGATPCTMSGTVTEDGVGAVLFRPGGASSIAPCTLLAAVDTATGSVKWSEDFAPGVESGEVSSVAVDDKTRAVYAIGGDRAVSYDVEDGKRRWQVGGAQFCSLTGHTAPTAIVVAQGCYDDNTSTIAALSLKTGRPLWRYRVPGTASSRITVLSAAPAVALINPGTASARGNITSFDDKGRPGKQIPQSQPYGKLPEGGLFAAYPKYAFNGSTMVVGVAKSGSSKVTTVAAFDLASGREKWHQTNASDKTVQVVGFDGEYVLAAEEGGYATQGQLIHYALDSGSPVRGGKFPTDTASSLDYNRMMVRGGLVLVLENYASAYNPRVTAFGLAR